MEGPWRLQRESESASESASVSVEDEAVEVISVDKDETEEAIAVLAREAFIWIEGTENRWTTKGCCWGWEDGRRSGDEEEVGDRPRRGRRRTATTRTTGPSSTEAAPLVLDGPRRREIRESCEGS